MIEHQYEPRHGDLGRSEWERDLVSADVQEQEYTDEIVDETPDSYDWGDISGEAVERMTKPKIAPCPAPIVAQAQRSVDRDPDKLVNTGVFEKDFGDVGKAETFMKFMKNAGQHTTPRCGMTVRQDPDKEGNKALIRWQAGKPRGRQPRT